MNSFLDEDDDKLDRNDREVTLSTGTILVIFLGLALLCGAFFGFGYKMGSHKPAPAVEAASSETAAPASTDFSGFKPAAGSPAGGSSAASSPKSAAVTAQPAPAPAESEPAPVVRSSPSPPAHTAATLASAPVPSASAAGSFVVQVAAVTHQEDANLLVSTLKAKGYPVAAHSEPQDKLFHIQVGPFSIRKDAETAKQRLLADGYQPIVK